MILPITVFGSTVLRKKTVEIDKDYNGLNKLIDDMFETMDKADGVGLAAPQIDRNIKLFVINTAPMDEAEDDTSLTNFKKVFINPEIVEETGKEWTYIEGCLSIPDIRENVSRKSEIRIQYYDKDFNFFDEKYDGIKARIIQHEYDHLDGVLFIDKISPIKKRLLKNKLRFIAKGKVDTKYKIKSNR